MKKFYPHTILFLICLAPVLNGFCAGNIDQLSHFFIENKGQVKGGKNTDFGDVLFYAEQGRMKLFITTHGYSLVTSENTPGGRKYHRVDVTLENAAINESDVVMVNTGSPVINIYRPEFPGGLVGIRSTGKLIIKNIYPGIDWLWYFDKQGRPEHNYMVNYGADASVIKYKVSGGKASVANDIITFTNEGLTAHEGPAVIRQRDKTFSPALNESGGRIGFKIPEELKEGGYTIDPPVELNWAAGYDTLNTAFKGIAADAGYNTYVTGYSSDYALPVIPEINGSYQSQDVQDIDVVVAKINYKDNLAWITFFGGANNDEGNAISLTPTGIFITGYSESWNFPVAVSGNYSSVVSLFGRDAFIAKFTVDGILKWSTGYGGSGTEEGMDVKYYNGHIYVGGYTNSKDFPVLQQSGAYFYNDTSRTRSDGFVLEFDTTGNREWATCFGGKAITYITSLYTDASGTYITGYADSISGTGLPLQQNGSAYYQNTYTGAESFIGRFTPANNSLQWSTYFGGAGNDYATSIMLTGAGLYICGQTTGAGLPVMNPNNGNFFQGTFGGGGSDGFIAKFNPNTQQEIYCSYDGGGGYDVLTSMGSDDGNNVVFTGFTSGNVPVNKPTPFYFTIANNAGAYDASMLGMDSNEHVFWSTLFGTTGYDFAYGVHVFNPWLVDMVGEGLYNYSKDIIGGTYRSTGFTWPLVTCNGVTNLFINIDSIGGVPGSFGGGGGGCIYPLYFQALMPLKNTCPQECNGKARIDTSNIMGCPPLSILWSDGGTSLVDSQLCENFWNMVSDNDGAQNILYGRFDVLRVKKLGTLKVNCNQVPDWASLIVPQGGGPPYQIVDRGTTGNGCPNTEYFEITDTAQCVVSYDVDWDVLNTSLTDKLSINQQCAITGTVKMGNNAQCVDLSVSGGWKYVLWTGSDTTVVPFSGSTDAQTLFAGVPGKSYNGYFDMGSCSTPLNSVFVFAPLDYKITATNSCGQENNGSVTIKVNPDVNALSELGNYSVSYNVVGGGGYHPGNLNFYSNAPQSITIDYLNPDSYVVFLNISGSCDSVTIVVPVLDIDFKLNNAKVYCAHQDTLVASVTGATPPVSFFWSGGSSSDSTLVINIPGTYGLTIIDSTGCQVSHSEDVPGSSGLIFNVNQNVHPCANTTNDDASVTMQGGEYPYTYLWSNGQTGDNATGLVPGTLGLTVTDNNGCRDSVSFVSPKQLPMTINQRVHNIICAGQQNGSIELDITNGYENYQVQWSDGSAGQFRSLLAEGTYRYTVTDNDNCTSSGTVNITMPDSLLYTVSTINALCADSNGGIKLVPSGGIAPYSVLWSDNDTNFVRTNIPQGNYTFNLTDSGGCQQPGKVKVDSVNPLNFQAFVTNVTCSGNGSDGSAGITLFNTTPPVQYSWSTGSGVPYIYNQPPGSYTVTVKDHDGCTLSVSLNIQHQSGPKINVDFSPILCSGGTSFAYVSVTGGTPPYSFSGDSSGEYPAGTYYASVIDSAGCSSTDTFSAIDPPPLFTYSQVLQLPSCNHSSGKLLEITSGGSPDYYVYIGGQSYGPYSDSIIISGIAQGGNFYITDAAGCIADDYADIRLYVPMSIQTTSYSSSCHGGNDGKVLIILSQGVGPFTANGSLFSDSLLVNGLSSGIYTYAITDMPGCTDSVTINIGQPPALFAADSVLTQGICSGDSEYVFFMISGGTPPYRGATPGYVKAGSYNEVITDTNGCSYDVFYTVATPPVFNADTIIRQPDCNSSQGTLSVTPTPGTGPYTLWHDSSTLYIFNDSVTIIVPPGSYTYYLSNDRNCVLDYSFTVQSAAPISGITNVVNDSCFGYYDGSIQVVMQTGNPPYAIGSHNFADTLTFNYLPAGVYNYTVTDASGCELTLSGIVNQPALLTIDTGYLQNGITCRDLTDGVVNFTVNGGQQPYEYLLFNQAGDTALQYHSQFSQLTAGNYFIQVVDNYGCQASMPVIVPPYIPIQDSLLTVNPDCNSVADGAIKLFAQPASYSPYSYSLNGSAPQVYNVFYNLAVGTYQVVITSAFDCTDTVNVTLVQPDSINSQVWLNGLVLPRDSVVIREQDFADFTKQNQNPWKITFSPPQDVSVSTDSMIQIQPRENVTYVVTIYASVDDTSCFIQFQGLIIVEQVAEFPNIITPNGDGMNDNWKIDKYIYPDANITIFDRWGETIYQSDHYDNDWAGTYGTTGKRVPDGTYFFVLTVPSKPGIIYRGDINVLDSGNGK